MTVADDDFADLTADDLTADATLRGRVRHAARHGDQTAKRVFREWQQRGEAEGPLAGQQTDTGTDGADGGAPTFEDPRRQALADAFTRAGGEGADPARLAGLARYYDPDRLLDEDGNADTTAIATIVATVAPGPAPTRRTPDLGQGRRGTGSGGPTVDTGHDLYADARGRTR